MENPNAWGLAERVIDEALKQSESNRREGRIGLSTPRLIADALRRAGLLVDEKFSEARTPEGRERWRAAIQEAKRTMTKEQFADWLKAKTES